MEWTSGNIFIRPNGPMALGDKIDGHRHEFDHTTIVFKGAIRVRAKCQDGRELEREFYSPRPDKPSRAHALILADVEHEIEAIEPDTIFWCVYSHRSPQGDVVQEFNGWMDAYSVAQT